MAGKDSAGPWLAIFLGAAAVILAAALYLSWLAGSRTGPIVLPWRTPAAEVRPQPQPLPTPLPKR